MDKDFMTDYIASEIGNDVLNQIEYDMTKESLKNKIKRWWANLMGGNHG